MKIKIGIIGVGMVGDPIRRWFEEVQGYKRGKDLFCYDADPKKTYTDDINKADVIFVSVPTPSNPDGSCNVSIVQSAVESINDGKTIIVKSTITPGTVEDLQKKYPRKKFIFNPEFLTESQVWIDYIRPDRQILGPTAKGQIDVKEVLSLLPLAPFSRPWASDYSKKSINATEAELVKYASNGFGYIKVIYGNILADISHALSQRFALENIKSSVDYENIREVLSADPRIGPAWLNVEHGSYSGAGGYCFPKDMNALIAFIEKDLILKLSKKPQNKGVVDSLKKGVSILKSVRDYNRALLKWQGLTEPEVSKHNHDLIVNKRKPIRVKK
ncbi:hypothetical protein KW791_00900 [Candidatus Parcubacteria bacterium]|nr:hypothetical protein [Candidatus Parcubacteria bacterium]